MLMRHAIHALRLFSLLPPHDIASFAVDADTLCRHYRYAFTMPFDIITTLLAAAATLRYAMRFAIFACH